jgi:hypothetical protein
MRPGAQGHSFGTGCAEGPVRYPHGRRSPTHAPMANRGTTMTVDDLLPADRASLINDVVGIIAVQAKCDTTEAFDRLRGRAAELGQTIEHTALDVFDDVIRFDSPAN